MRRAALFLLLFLLACTPPDSGPAPELQLSRSALSLSTVAQDTLIIRNLGEPNSVLDWSIESSSSLLSLSSRSGQLRYQEETSVTVSLSSAWPPTTPQDSADLSILAGNTKRTVTVQLPGFPKADTPMILISQSSIALDKGSATGSLVIRNIGGVASMLNWSVAHVGNLIFAPASGSIEGGKELRVFVTVDQRRVSANQDVTESFRILSNDTDGKTPSVFVTYNLPSSGLELCGTFPSSQQISLSTATAISGLPYVADELLVQFAAGTLQSQATRDLSQAVLHDFQLQELKMATNLRPALVRVPAGRDVLEFAKSLESDPRVAYAEPNYYLTTLSLPNDPLLSKQWHLGSFGIPEAWQLPPGAKPVVIAVIDSGFDIAHEDLALRMLPGCDFFNGDNDPRPASGMRSDQINHGTHVAGVAAATGNNAVGVAGVAYGPNIRILPLKVFDDLGVNGSVDRLLDALLWAAGYDLPGVGRNPNPAQVINMSVGASPTQERLKSLNEVTRQVNAKGVVMVAAAGNNGQMILLPAADEFVIAVGSVDQDYRRSPFSNYSATGPTVDFMAPGGIGSGGMCAGVLSTIPGSEYACMEGTSMAAPFVAGLAALLLAQDSTLSPAEVKTKLQDSALFTDSMTSAEYGAGVVCADKALGASTRCGMSLPE